MNIKRNRTNRVIFFSKEDLAGPHMLTKAEILMDTPPDNSLATLDDLMEFFHIKQYFDHNLFLSSWTEEQLHRYKNLVNTFFDQTRKYFLDFDPENIKTILKELDFNDHKPFWKLFSLFEVYKRLERKAFLNVLETFPHHIREVLELKTLVGHFNNEIRTFLISYSKNAELLLSHFEEQHNGRESKYIFPKSLNSEDIYGIIENYLESKEPNLNYVELAKNSKYLKLPPKLLLKAKRVAKTIQDQFLTEENSTIFAVEATLDMLSDNPVHYEKSGLESKVTYGGAYLDSLTNDIELFNEFNQLFFYTDKEGLITLVNKDAEMDNLEKVFMQSKSTYPTGITFTQKNMESLIQLQIMSAYLAKKERSLEELIQSFTHRFFEEKHELKNLAFNLPNPQASPLDKIRLLAPELEYLLKQYKSFVTEGIIDHDLLQIDSTPLYFSDIPSLVQKHYVNSDDQSISKLQHQFFDQHGILSGHVSYTGKNLFQILMTQNVVKSQLEDYQRQYFDYLEQEGSVKTDDKGTILITDPLKVFIAGKLRKNGSMSYWKYSLLIRNRIDKLTAENVLKISAQLFTSEEVSYFNYFLNKKEFTNSHDLRNKYLHGSNDHDIQKQQHDYHCFLRIVILILLKLKEDIELHDMLKVNTNTVIV